MIALRTTTYPFKLAVKPPNINSRSSSVPFFNKSSICSSEKLFGLWTSNLESQAVSTETIAKVPQKYLIYFFIFRFIL